MRLQRPILAVVAILAVTVLSSCTKQGPAPPGTSGPATTTSPAPPKRSTPHVAEKGTGGEVDRLEEAAKRLEAKDGRGAAADIREASGKLKEEAAVAQPEVKKELQDAAKELGSLAKSVESGTVTKVGECKGAFARAEKALARSQHAKALDAIGKKQGRQAGEALKAATDHLERAAKWAGHEIDPEGKKALEDARALGAKLIDGTARAAAETGAAAEKLSVQIRKWGQEVKPAKASP